MGCLLILNDAPCGTKRTNDGLRLALSQLAKAEGLALTVFLKGDAASAARAGQQTPNGYYNLERMLKCILARKGRVLICGTCMDARGLREGDVVEGYRRGTLDELTELTAAAGKVHVF